MNCESKMGRIVMLEEGQQNDASLDLDGALCEENYGKGINENYNVEDLCKPLNK